MNSMSVTMPTLDQFDYPVQELTADPQITVPTTQAGTYYILVYSDHLGGNAAVGLSPPQRLVHPWPLGSCRSRSRRSPPQVGTGQAP